MNSKSPEIDVEDVSSSAKQNNFNLTLYDLI